MTVGLVRPTSDADFRDVVLGATAPVVVAFHHAGAVPAYVDDLARETGWACFVTLDADRWPRTPAAYRVVRLPLLLVFVAGEPVLVVADGQPLDRVRQVLAALR